MQYFQDFLNSALGQGLTVVTAAVTFICLSGLFFRVKGFSVRALTYTGIALASAFLLSYVRLFSMPQGGSVSPMSMFFVTLVGFWFGPAIGLVGGITFGILQVVQGAWVIHPMQFLLDYPLAFGMLGLSGFFWKVKGGMYIGFIVACLGRFVMSTLAGWIYWIGVDQPGALWGSMVYNGSYIFTEMALTLAIIFVPQIRHALDYVKKGVLKRSLAT